MGNNIEQQKLLNNFNAWLDSLELQDENFKEKIKPLAYMAFCAGHKTGYFLAVELLEKVENGIPIENEAERTVKELFNL